ncbi:MAG: FkbM family methyltransferase [Bacteroidota bacterium]
MKKIDWTNFLNSLRHIKWVSFNAVTRTIELCWRDRIRIGIGAKKDEVIAIIEQLRPIKLEKGLIRIGGPRDGGYLMPDDLQGVVACISPGVSDEVSFDVEMANRGMKVILADASVEGPPIENGSFEFHKKFLGPKSNQMFIRLDDLVNDFAPAGDLLLQMDIEGAEYSVLLDCSEETLARFRIIVLEIHDLGAMFGKFGAGVVATLVEKLNRSHLVVHNHANNCCGSETRFGIEVPRVMELTFYRRDRLGASDTSYATLPHPLDADNVPARPPLQLAKVWSGAE